MTPMKREPVVTITGYRDVVDVSFHFEKGELVIDSGTLEQVQRVFPQWMLEILRDASLKEGDQ